jgi:hypothetical protein
MVVISTFYPTLVVMNKLQGNEEELEESLEQEIGTSVYVAMFSASIVFVLAIACLCFHISVRLALNLSSKKRSRITKERSGQSTGEGQWDRGMAGGGEIETSKGMESGLGDGRFREHSLLI